MLTLTPLAWSLGIASAWTLLGWLGWYVGKAYLLWILWAAVAGMLGTAAYVTDAATQKTADFAWGAAEDFAGDGPDLIEREWQPQRGPMEGRAVQGQWT
eukprot:8994783-Alexandrium_andersonii.AAC.1